MSRSTIFVFFIFILACVLDQSQGLASVVRGVRRAGIWGKLTGKRTVGLTDAPSSPVAVSEPVFSPITPSVGSGGFDADAYRREMTDLVYQRSMERSF